MSEFQEVLDDFLIAKSQLGWVGRFRAAVGMALVSLGQRILPSEMTEVLRELA